MERRGVDAEHAFALLRRRARSSERMLADVARELLAPSGQPVSRVSSTATGKAERRQLDRSPP